MKVSNKFTLARVIFAPVFFLLYFIPIWTNSDLLAFISACVIIPALILIQITDYWDGHYARKYNEVSDFGKLFDPFADVILNLSVFLCAITSYYVIPGTTEKAHYMPIVIFVLLMWREFGMNFVRMVAVSNGTAIAARKGGKLKTVFYIISAFFYLAIEAWHRVAAFFQIEQGLKDLTGCNIPFDSIYTVWGYICLGFFCVCLLLSYISFADYLVSFKSVLKAKSDK